MEDSDRDKLLQMNAKEMSVSSIIYQPRTNHLLRRDVAMFVNSYPNMDVSYELQKQDSEYTAGAPLILSVTLTRDTDEDEDDGQVVIAPFYPARKMANWWLVVGNSVARQLLAIRKVTVRRNLTTKLTFTLPQGKHNLKLYVICDSYSGADHDVNLEPITVVEGDASDSDESESEEEMEE